MYYDIPLLLAERPSLKSHIIHQIESDTGPEGIGCFLNTVTVSLGFLLYLFLYQVIILFKVISLSLAVTLNNDYYDSRSKNDDGRNAYPYYS